MINNKAVDILEKIQKLYEKAFETIAPQRPVPDVEVRFYPYVGINHTIRVRDGKVFVRIAELCRDMPLPAHEGLAWILVCKLLRKKVPAQARERYSRFIKSDEVRSRATENKRIHGRKVITSHTGSAYDLGEVFDGLNEQYFGGKLHKPVLTWSARKTYRILGHHDSTHKTIAVSRSLDDRSVPRYVVEFVVFHEMLHIAHPTIHHNGRRYNHTPAFRRDERKFEYFDEAEKWIERNVRKLKRSARRK